MRGRKSVIDHFYVSESVVHKLSDHGDKCKEEKEALRAVDGLPSCVPSDMAWGILIKACERHVSDH